MTQEQQQPRLDPHPQTELKPDPARWLPGLRNALDEQIVLAERIDQISDRQSALIAEGNFDMAAEMLSDRQPLVERMSDLAAELAPMSGRIGEMAFELPSYDRGTLIERVTRLQGLLDAINHRDQCDRTAFEQHRQRLSAELAGVDRGRMAAQSYQGPQEPGPTFQDREG
jgi:hypothetical protein